MCPDSSLWWGPSTPGRSVLVKNQIKLKNDFPGSLGHQIKALPKEAGLEWEKEFLYRPEMHGSQ